MGEADIIKAITELGQTLRGELMGEIKELRTEAKELRAQVKEVAHNLMSFRLMVEEEFIGIRRDNASLRREVFAHEQKIEALEKKAG